MGDWTDLGTIDGGAKRGEDTKRHSKVQQAVSDRGGEKQLHKTKLTGSAKN